VGAVGTGPERAGGEGRGLMRSSMERCSGSATLPTNSLRRVLSRVETGVGVTSRWMRT
jgi:hypothetical protein